MDGVPSGSRASNASNASAATPQIRKLGIRPGHRVCLVAAPRGWRLTDPPQIVRAAAGPADVLLWFVRESAALADVPAHAERIFPAGAMWIAWPRRAAGHLSDVTENAIRDAVLPLGLVDVKVAAIDDDWSGLKIVWRTENRVR
ncbi:MAG: hypothetical protein QOI15_1257 [Pseudonocardiales bacterium]|jgi:hypothetical protein|nr:hypothetical protein [Pseudonocardiales bacterium]MDT4920355.1 hypothetical protein [Pseudonocardiales bacterium]